MELCITLGGGPPSAERAKTDLWITWQTLSAARQVASSTAGVYWLGAPFNIAYGKTISRIFYIGSAISLRRRLEAHATLGQRGNLLVRVFASGDPSNILCAFHSLPELKEDELRGFEYGLVKIFGRTHGFIPYGNRMPPDNESDEGWGDRLRVTEPETPG